MVTYAHIKFAHESLQKRIEKMFKKKVIEGCIQKAMFDQCFCGH